MMTHITRVIAGYATEYCANIKGWHKSESTAWVWEDTYARMLLEDVKTALKDAGYANAHEVIDKRYGV